MAFIAALSRRLDLYQPILANQWLTLLDVTLNIAQVASARDAFIQGVCPALPISQALVASLNHTLIADGAAGVFRGELL